MSLEVVQIRIFRFVLALICHVNQIIEAGTIQVTTYDRPELLFVQAYQNLHGFTEGVQKLFRFLAEEHASHSPPHSIQSPQPAHNVFSPAINIAIRMPSLPPFGPRQSPQELEFFRLEMFQESRAKTGLKSLCGFP